MEKILESETAGSHGGHRILVGTNGDYCCYIMVDGMAATKDDPFACVSVGRLTSNIGPDYLKTFKGRVKVVWEGLRGRLWGADVELYTREDCDRLITALTEMRDLCFPEEACPKCGKEITKASGGNICQYCGWQTGAK